MANHDNRTFDPSQAHRSPLVFVVALLLASMAAVSAHVVRGGHLPTAAVAFISSPTSESDAPIKVAWPGVDGLLRVVCFYAANISVPRVDDDDWPRVTAVGLELPGTPTGFSLLEPLGGQWKLVEGIGADIPHRGTVTLDVAVVAKVNPAGFEQQGPHFPLGIPPGQVRARRNGTRFCIGGPFPDTLPKLDGEPGDVVDTTIELLLNGVVVGFHRVEGAGPSTDIGVWESTSRVVPLYPD